MRKFELEFKEFDEEVKYLLNRTTDWVLDDSRFTNNGHQTVFSNRKHGILLQIDKYDSLFMRDKIQIFIPNHKTGKHEKIKLSTKKFKASIKNLKKKLEIRKNAGHIFKRIKNKRLLFDLIKNYHYISLASDKKLVEDLHSQYNGLFIRDERYSGRVHIWSKNMDDILMIGLQYSGEQ